MCAPLMRYCRRRSKTYLEPGKSHAKRAEIPDWETLSAHAAALRTKIPSAIVVGRTAAAVHSRHRFSIDHDHVGANFANDCDTVIRVGNYRWLAYKSPAQRDGAHTRLVRIRNQRFTPAETDLNPRTAYNGRCAFARNQFGNTVTPLNAVRPTLSIPLAPCGRQARLFAFPSCSIFGELAVVLG